MLSPDYLLRVSEGGEAIAETLHDEIIKQIVERIALRLDRGDNYILTARDKWQIEVLQDAGFLREDIEKEIAKRVKLMQEEIAKAMEDAGVKSMEWDDEIYRAAGLSPKPLDESPYLIRLMQRTYEATMGDWINFTRTTADASQQAFIRACDKAYTMVASGAMGYGQAYADAINDIVADGVTVTYPSGHTDTIETATLRCIRTGVSQATAQITDARMDEMDWDIILVSSHLGARVTDKEDFTNHYWWQGKFYSKSGKDTRFPPYSVCNEGHVQGIHGCNCRHSHGPSDGEFNPFEHYDSEENRKEYELQQRQRAMERRIRESKRKCMGLKHGVDIATTDEAKAAAETLYQKEAALLQKRNKAYNDFCEENGLKRKSERITIARWDREQAAKARAAAGKAEKTKPSGQKVQVQKAMAEKKVEAPQASAFTPAKTIEEAEQYGKRFVTKKTWSGNGEISYKGLSIENANKMNETLTDLFATYDMPLFENIKPMNFRQNIWKGSENAPFAYRSSFNGELYFNPKIAKNAKAFEDYFKKGEEAFEICKKNIDRFSGSQRKMVERYVNAGRQLVADDAKDKFVASIQHEFGHHIQNQALWKNKDAVERMNERIDEFGAKLSGYASSSKGEYVAESFCAFMNGETEKIDPFMKQYFEGLKKR